MANWCELPLDLLCIIVMRFETMEDLIYFSLVCRLWNQFASTVKHAFHAKITPWLLLAETTENNPDCVRNVLNPVNDKCYPLKLPETAGCKCWGSAYGWIATYNDNLDLHLFNPLTKARMSLPPVACLPLKWGPHVCIGTHENFYEGSAHAMMRGFIKKVFVLKVGADDYVVFVTYFFSSKKLAFARPGDESWISIDQPGSTHVDLREARSVLSNCAVEVVCYGSQILILYENASVGYLDVSELSASQKPFVKDYSPIYPMILGDPHGLKAREFSPAPPGILQGLSRNVYGLYLVESRGNLLMVVRDRYFLAEDDRRYETNDFIVYKLDLDDKSWSRLKNLGDIALFVGNHSSMSVPTNEEGYCEPNSIYYTDDEENSWHAGVLIGEDMGVFSLESDEFEDVYDGRDKYSKLQTPLWFMPEF